MASDRLALAGLALALALGMAAGSAGAQTPPVAVADPAQDRALADAYVDWMARVFLVPDTPDIDAPLREAMTSLVTEHLARLDRLIPAWIAEERAHRDTPITSAALNRAVHNRLANEIALWRLESPGPAYDAALLRALLKPGLCNLPVRTSYLGVLMVWLQAVPPADRATVLDGERTLLAHWGQPRAALPPRPAKALSVDEEEAIARLRSGQAEPDPAMPPILADSVFKGKLAPAFDAVNCALHQWGLAQALHRGDPPAVALAAWRYQTLRTATDWSSAPTTPRGPTDYPTVALSDGVSGAVDLRVTTDAQGRFASAVVARRTLVVPGVTDNAPVAFETLFDKASLAQAAVQFKPVQPAADGSPVKTATIRISWRLP